MKGAKFIAKWDGEVIQKELKYNFRYRQKGYEY